MGIKQIIIIIVILLILSSIPFLFGKQIKKDVNQESQSTLTENSQSVQKNQLEATQTNKENTAPAQTTTPAPTPTPISTTTPDLSSNNPNTPTPVSITIAQFAFKEGTVTVKKGTIITWTNQDSSPHTVTSDTASVFDSDTMAKGKTFNFTFNTVGSFSYHCAFHPSMRGTVVVTN